MTLPWTCDALLPAAERYSSLKFRRFARLLYVDRLDYGDAQELCAFLGTVGVHAGRWIFQWPPRAVREAKRLLAHMLKDEDVVEAIEANRRAYTREAGLATLRAMQDGGFTSGPVPEIVRFAFLDMRDAGINQQRIADAVGLTLDQVRVMANGPRWRRSEPVPLSAAGLFAA